VFEKSLFPFRVSLNVPFVVVCVFVCEEFIHIFHLLVCWHEYFKAVWCTFSTVVPNFLLRVCTYVYLLMYDCNCTILSAVFKKRYAPDGVLYRKHPMDLRAKKYIIRALLDFNHGWSAVLIVLNRVSRCN
jgi:hypothetical protein